jgi:hypothetical protein
MDKDTSGNYLISSRHCSTIYYVSGVDKSIIWRLSGHSPLSNYTLQNFNFSFQHDIRFQNRSVVNGVNTTVLTFFDNDSDETTINAPRSRGMIVELSDTTVAARYNHGANSTQIGSAKLLQDFYAPVTPLDPAGLLTRSQGNVQILPNGNIGVGWGNNSFISEYASDGTPLYFAYFNNFTGNSYRAYKYPFVGNPSSSPSIYSYALTKTSSATTTHWVSWNGCTKCAYWMFFEADKAEGPFTPGQKVSRTGFETNYTSSGYAAYAYAKALDASGNVLGTSQIESTFVPGPGLASLCNGYGCPAVS